ncbi:MAG: cytidylyltransferase domain-containing protein [Gaiellaceae bacterium]
MSSAVALVPARGGSLRVPGKNVMLLGGHPLIAYTIAAARESGIFTEVVVSTDSEAIAEVAARYGGTVLQRPPALATSTSPDVDWVVHAMDGRTEDAFALLRPTSPFRNAATILRAWERFLALGDTVDSLRAVELCRQHPAKMWTLEGELIRPVLERPDAGTPWHSMQYQALPPVYVQNSSLEIAWRRVLDGEPSIAGARVAAFLTESHEGFTIDYPDDAERAELLVARGEVEPPRLLEVVQ